LSHDNHLLSFFFLHTFHGQSLDLGHPANPFFGLTMKQQAIFKIISLITQFLTFTYLIFIEYSCSCIFYHDYQPDSRQNWRNTFKQGRQIFLWADVDKDSNKKGIKNKMVFKSAKVFLNEPAR